MLGDKRFIQSLKLTNLLSFGPDTEEFELKALNVLIGPNASGKSNFIEAVGLLKASARDLTYPIRLGGGVGEWLWKGAKGIPVAEIDATIYYPDGIMPLRHKLSFTMVGQRFELVDESIENKSPERSDQKDVRFYYRYGKGHPALRFNPENGAPDPAGAPLAAKERDIHRIPRESLESDQSILSQRKDPFQYPELTYLGLNYEKIQLYREWHIGRNTLPRIPQKADMPHDFLLEEADNLSLVLNDLEHRPGMKNLLFGKMKEFYNSFDFISPKIHDGTVQLFMHEQWLEGPIRATRLSDGTLRYLCLLAILCHPSPPPLICIEEPELGMHPDILPIIAELLVEASHHTQVIVTTHSDMIVDALTKTPEAVIVCEREKGATTLNRQDPDRLQEWLNKYKLGELWTKGEIGGNRW